MKMKHQHQILIKFINDLENETYEAYQIYRNLRKFEISTQNL